MCIKRNCPNEFWQRLLHALFIFIVLFFTDVDGDWTAAVNLYPGSFETHTIGWVHSNNVV